MLASLRTHLISVATFLHPLSNPCLGLFELVVIGGINEVSCQELAGLLLTCYSGKRRGGYFGPLTALFVEKVEDLFGFFLVALAHVLAPSNRYLLVISVGKLEHHAGSRTTHRQSSWHPDIAG